MNMQKDEITKEVAMQYAARKAAGDEFFLGSAIQLYQRKEALDDKALAHFLGIAPELLHRLALCRRPYSTDPTTFRRDISSIATKFAIETRQLAALLRRAEAYEASRSTSTYLMAARDYDEELPEIEKEQEE